MNTGHDVLDAETRDAASLAGEAADASADAAAEEALAESLIEDVSIDGMCGVY
ncbi:mycofactocin precursor MftA [Yinghuangia sp. ASG 101]|uniref:mycofactocin precursor MftA n=1 Tax=Yinghuangia sp. ASG 101 TaxID=2896848 RepID=UPI001E2C0CC1|nr:mycofactocin precursor MftA [Yinghuangia sp. ASG 101]UGQ12661.1 mycofactocin precursor MftA [Yinghuangia sp. ASG 101]